jgi:hydroxyethylthiazole kinase-like uncharacterized protein yjeF
MSMTALYSLNEIRAVESAAQAVLPQGTLMQAAGSASAALAMCLLTKDDGPQRILVLAGPGNNGGDALDAAARLSHGCDVAILLFADPASLPPNAQQAYERALHSSAEFLDAAEAPSALLGDWSLVIDGLFGIGLSRPISGTLHDVIAQLNRRRLSVLAIDIPSGLDADTGTIVGGKSGIAVAASQTITFIGDKPGLHTCDGRDYAGMVTVATLDIDAAMFPVARAMLNSPALFGESLRPRRQNSHKGSYGDVAIVGGAQGMTGAALLAGRAAAKSGAGRTFIAFAGETPALDAEQPELMCRSAHEFDLASPILVVGTGLGISAEAKQLLTRALASKHPMVIDADALNLIAQDPSLQKMLTERSAASILTPHPLEAARLLGMTSAEVQADRPAAARTLAQRFHAITIVKGSGSIIAEPQGTIVVNPTGNPGLATAGSGDVLAGVCGALLAQGWPAWEAALGAVWLHGSAADELVRQGIGPIGLTAGELIAPIRNLINRLASQ